MARHILPGITRTAIVQASFIAANALLFGVALGFHLANVYAFGLNRFLFAWLAAYPALYYCSSLLHP